MKRPALKSLLLGRGLRLIDLATRLGVDKSTVTRWAQGEVPHDRVEDVALATGIPPRELRPDLADIFSPSTKEAAE